jgi:hypothetical protein
VADTHQWEIKEQGKADTHQWEIKEQGNEVSYPWSMIKWALNFCPCHRSNTGAATNRKNTGWSSLGSVSVVGRSASRNYSQLTIYMYTEAKNLHIEDSETRKYSQISTNYPLSSLWIVKKKDRTGGKR